MNKPTSFQLKGSLYTMPSIHFLSTDLTVIENELLKQITTMPKFFSNAPVVLELNTLVDRGLTLDFKALVKIMREFALLPVGVKGGTEELHQAAMAAGLGVFPDSKPLETSGTTAQKTNAVKTGLTHKTLIIKEQVRSGRRIYAQNSDLIVLAPVSSGAEILADGNIHVYAPLRGRAHAGVKDSDETARIFCHEFDAQLVSIGGHYKHAEEFSLDTKDAGMMQIYFENGSLHFAPIYSTVTTSA